MNACFSAIPMSLKSPSYLYEPGDHLGQQQSGERPEDVVDTARQHVQFDCKPCIDEKTRANQPRVRNLKSVADHREGDHYGVNEDVARAGDHPYDSGGDQRDR